MFIISLTVHEGCYTPLLSICGLVVREEWKKRWRKEYLPDLGWKKCKIKCCTKSETKRSIKSAGKSRGKSGGRHAT